MTMTGLLIQENVKMVLKSFLSLGVVAVAFHSFAIAQELQIDTKALDASGIVSAHPAKGKKNKAALGAESQTNNGATNQPATAANRQFGELEGWSPGKEPPPSKYAVDRRKKHDEAADGSAHGESGTIKPSMRPTGMSGGNVGMGMSF